MNLCSVTLIPLEVCKLIHYYLYIIIGQVYCAIIGTEQVSPIPSTALPRFSVRHREVSDQVRLFSVGADGTGSTNQSIYRHEALVNGVTINKCVGLTDGT